MCPIEMYLPAFQGRTVITQSWQPACHHTVRGGTLEALEAVHNVD